MVDFDHIRTSFVRSIFCLPTDDPQDQVAVQALLSFILSEAPHMLLPADIDALSAYLEEAVPKRARAGSNDEGLILEIVRVAGQVANGETISFAKLDIKKTG